MFYSNYFVFTGGPGGGKSTVLREMEEMGYPTVEEAGRNIIRRQTKLQGDGVPWGDRARYARLMFLQSVMDFEQYAHLVGPCFFDRGIPDTLGYCRLVGIPLPKEYAEAAERYRYNGTVFLFPFWEEIYIQDVERKQDKAEAQATCRVLRETYEALGYRILTVPFGTPGERARWIAGQVPLFRQKVHQDGQHVGGKKDMHRAGVRE